MIYPLEQVKEQVSKTDQQLIYHLILEQQETNRLLREIIGTKTPEAIEPEIIEDETKDLKRPELMKLIAKHENKPDGFNKWDNEKMRDFLRGNQK